MNGRFLECVVWMSIRFTQNSEVYSCESQRKFMFRQPSANVGRPRPSCITLFEGLQIGSSLILMAATATNGTCVCPSWIMLGSDQQWLRGAPFHDLALSMSLGYPQGLHLKPLKPQLPSWFDGRLFRGKCLLRPKSTNSSWFCDKIT